MKVEAGDGSMINLSVQQVLSLWAHGTVLRNLTGNRACGDGVGAVRAGSVLGAGAWGGRCGTGGRAPRCAVGVGAGCGSACPAWGRPPFAVPREGAGGLSVFTHLCACVR